MIEDRFDLTVEENIFLAKKILVDIIYNAAILEGCKVSYFQVEKIIKGINDADVSLKDIVTLLNLKTAWIFLLNNLDKEINFDFMKAVNLRISRNENLDPGVLRYGDVGVSLHPKVKLTRKIERYIPELPNMSKISGEIENLNKIENITEKAINYYIWGMRRQLFWDGNKRTSNLIANSILIRAGKGIISIEARDLDEFSEKLSDFYITNKSEELVRFIYEKGIRGMKIDRKLKEKNRSILKIEK